MKIEWFSAERLGEKYCRIKMSGCPTTYVFPKKMSNIYALCAVRYGSVDRGYKIADGPQIILPDGIAHFLEHKMFAQPDGRDAFDIFSEYGADANAYTSYDRTVYLFNCTDNFSQSFSTLLDLITHPHFTDENVANEQGIIAQEIGMYADDPDAVCYENMLSAMYFEHPVKINVCGTAESIKQITPKLLYDCHSTFYNPDNMVVVVCGDVEPEQVARLVSEQGEWGKPVLFERCSPREISLPRQKKVTAHMKVSIPLFALGFKETKFLPSAYARHRQDIAASILERMLFSTSSELYNELYDEGLLTSPLSVGRIAEDGYAFTELCGSSNRVDEVYDRIISHLNKKRQNGLSNDDFERCKRKRLGDAISRFDSTEEIANSLIGYAFDDLDILNDPEIIESITFKDVSVLFDEMYHEQNAAVSYMMPIK